MKITLAIPKGKDVKTKLEKEKSLALNIKDKNTMNDILIGLNKITRILEDGKVYLYDSDDDSLQIYNYPINEFVYHCGPEFVKPKTNVSLDNKYLLIAMDANEVTIGITQGGKNPQIIYNEQSMVPGKHNSGGQSKARFQRNRQLALEQWYKHIGQKLKELT